MMKEKAKEIAFTRGKESVKGVSVFPNDKVGEETDFFVGLGKTIVRGDGNEEFISDSLAVNDRSGGPSFR
jgi:hypothetical protein